MSSRMLQPNWLTQCALKHNLIPTSTSPFVITCAMAPKTSKAEQDLLTVIEGMTPAKPKNPSQPPDMNRKIEMDPRDPRAQGTWPCYNQHQPGTWQKNAHGMWRHCDVCNVRMVYVPRQGAPSSSIQAMNHSMVQQMLAELQPLMQNCKPTARICKAMMDKITAEAQLRTLITSALKNPVPVEEVPISTPKAKAKPGGQSTSSSPHSWEVPVEEDMASALEMQMAENLEQ